MEKFTKNIFFRILIFYFLISFLLPQLGFLIPIIVIFSLFFSIFSIFKTNKVKPKYISVFFLFFFLWTLFIFVFTITLLIVFLKDNMILINFKASIALLCTIIITVNFLSLLNAIIINYKKEFDINEISKTNNKYIKYLCFWEKLIMLERIIWYRHSISSI
ncbi:hypothetical protein CK556_01330 [Mesoplasma chauliocola]|uniref:Uncharacterized protein n=1 Tax=Mesoplasma chauliocola TaxID=216427 RepID=A0A249SN22_9MOLU|nr:hypothetical protein CK556_01330 [Mesoplasma chauliocola]